MIDHLEIKDMTDSAFLLHTPAGRQWHRIGAKPHHGLTIPLFSLHSNTSSGVGEFTDLIRLIDWCKTIGFDLIQLLPLNDTGLGTSPYSALSAFALNPIYLNLQTLPLLDESSELQSALKAVPHLEKNLRLDYKTARENKEQFLRQYYERLGPAILNSTTYHQFQQNASWLKGYALYKTLKAKYQWANWESWPTEYQEPTLEVINRWEADNQDEVNWHCLLQYLCHQQLYAVRQHADHQGIFLMGDIPILIDRDSADVWLNRAIFDLHFSAGAPPDYFCQEGQNWGFPIYKWEQIAREDYRWWIDRLNTAGQYYHIYRIDHIVGFFRIWAIPRGLTGKDGYFIPQDKREWIDHGKQIMIMMLNSCDMLPIGEDLGTVPPEVRECLKNLGISGTKVMRWERFWNDDSRFIPPQEYALTSMTTVSTHDCETLQQWWQDLPHESQLFAQYKGWHYVPALSHSHQREILWDSHHSGSLFHINLLQEYLALVPGLTWPNIADERINLPGVLSDNNWTYRYKPSIEEIVSNEALASLMRELIT